MRRILFWGGLIFLAPLARSEPTALEHLTVFLTGTFSNAAQARGDQNFRKVTLHVAPIWPGRSDGPWLYAEQALADAPSHPYRQVVYQLVNRSDDTVEIRQFDLSDPVAATELWQEPARADKWTTANLVPRSGCSLILHLQPGGFFKGGTEGQGCASPLRGVSYTTIEATVSNLEIALWERGYNDSGIQVWGSAHGGNIFKRVE
ncbi:MAG TPA: chromophore lyase CpcT/CpeT [Lacunisphaera sp.]